MKLPVCSLEGGRHFSLCLPADSPLPGPDGDLDHPRKHCHSSCPVIRLLLLTLPETNRSRRRNWTPRLPPVVLPGPSPGPPTQICFFEFHAVSVTLPFKLNIVVIYCPPGLYLQKKRRNSWSKFWSSPSWTTVTPSCLDSQPLRLNHCRASRTLHARLQSTQILPCDPPPP